MLLTAQKESEFKQALDTLDSAFSYAKSLYQVDVLKLASSLIDEDGGLEKIYMHSEILDKSGIFQDGPWEDPSKLQPKLVKGSLLVGGKTAIKEILSDIRMLAIAKGEVKHDKIEKKQARIFLNEAIAVNLDFLFPKQTEFSRIEDKKTETERAGKLFEFLVEKLSLKEVAGTLIKEIDRLVAQRPIRVSKIISIIERSNELLGNDITKAERKSISHYYDAIYGCTLKSKECKSIQEYRNALKEMTDPELKSEAHAFAKSMKKTGLVCSQHAVLVRYLNRYKSDGVDLISASLGLNKKGIAELEHYLDKVKLLIKVSIHPSTRQTVYGLSCLLERGVLSSMPVIAGIFRLVELDLLTSVKKALLDSVGKNAGITANDILVADTINVLGQPLGVGQGMNPTCQTARGISLWALHAPGFLLELIPRAARDGDVDIIFEGEHIHSKDLEQGLVGELSGELDAVSIVLVPHLDRLYNELIRRVNFRGEDAHKWVNPAFYGNWVLKGFSSVVDLFTGWVTDYSRFVKLFYATHHTEYNDGYELIYPNPVGIFITNAFGNLLGFHAVSIQRITKFEEDEYRIYFYNPNNDSSQNWGQGIETSVAGKGESPGESSLPFEQFVSRLYAFHYNPYEKGDASAVEDEIVQRIERLSKESWGKEYVWTN